MRYYAGTTGWAQQRPGERQPGRKAYETNCLWYARQDSNLRPLTPEASALSAELRARTCRVYRNHSGRVDCANIAQLCSRRVGLSMSRSYWRSHRIPTRSVTLRTAIPIERFAAASSLPYVAVSRTNLFFRRQFELLAFSMSSTELSTQTRHLHVNRDAALVLGVPSLYRSFNVVADHDCRRTVASHDGKVMLPVSSVTGSYLPKCGFWLAHSAAEERAIGRTRRRS